jgi:hypothetical protein
VPLLSAVFGVAVARCTVTAQSVCGANKWNNRTHSHDQSDCILCPADSSTLGVSTAPSSRSCVCNARFYARDTLGDGSPHCKPCVVGIVCDKPGTRRYNLTLVPGYWR